ncbi:hypothetical protein [Chitinophaga alhagiae]|uniref:hypothetical protein n=1 Tax=Chitinophaga alhagiae TaxID=2203219 RepID=UPI000E5BEBE1|nr:hypothetical protein [Chitinophaga alhagiae]
MATQTSLLKFTGKVGNLIGYRVGKKYYLRSAPEQVRQSPHSKVSSRHFGKASRLGATMRHALHGLLHVKQDNTLINRLNKSLLHVLRQDDLHRQKRFIPRYFRDLERFCFTTHADLSRVLPVEVSAVRNTDGSIAVTVPAIRQHLCNPRATHVGFRAVAVCLERGFATAKAAASDMVMLKADEPSAAFSLTVPADGNTVTCVILEVTSWQVEHGRPYLLGNRKFMAAEVIAVLQPEAAIVVREEPVPHGTQRQPRVQPPVVPGLVIHHPQRE